MSAHVPHPAMVPAAAAGGTGARRLAWLVDQAIGQT
jgi:hypothetical protein